MITPHPYCERDGTYAIQAAINYLQARLGRVTQVAVIDATVFSFALMMPHAN